MAKRNAASKKAQTNPKPKPIRKKADTNGKKKRSITVDSDSDNQTGKQNTQRPRIKWTQDLTDTLLSELTDNVEIKQGLFPSPGTVGLDEDGNAVTKSNTLTKTDYQFMLAEAVFSREDCGYKETFDGGKDTSQGRTWWAGKVKSKLEDLLSKYRECRDLMGETGQGLTGEEQIDMSQKNALTDAWTKVKKTLPQYFTLVGLVGERPNIEPVGLGNANADVDPSFLLEKQVDSASASLPGSDFGDDMLSGFTSGEEVDELKSDGEAEEKIEAGKRKREDSPGPNDVETSNKQARGPKQNKSKKADKPVPKKGSNMFDKFAEVSKEEEKTRQKRIDLREAQLNTEKELAKEKIRVAGQTKVEKERIRADFELQKMKLELDFRLAMAKGSSVPALPVPTMTASQNYRGSDGSHVNNYMGLSDVDYTDPFSSPSYSGYHENYSNSPSSLTSNYPEQGTSGAYTDPGSLM